MLTKELIRRIRKIEITTNRAVNDHLAGRYHSVFRGRGMEFDEVRPYVAGDDVRSIDWNVSARTGELYVKRFVEERQLTVMLLVDASASGAFASRGDRLKAEISAEISALIAFSAIKNNDRVGLIVFTDRVETFVAPKRGRKHVLGVISQILNRPAAEGRGTDVARALEYLYRVTRRGTVAFLISDFLALGYEQAMRVAARRHDLVPIVVADPLEQDLPDVGLLSLRDPETGGLFVVDTSDRRTRDDYARRRAARRAELERLFRRLDVEAVSVSTGQDYVAPLVNYFRRRARRAAA